MDWELEKKKQEIVDDVYWVLIMGQKLETGLSTYHWLNPTTRELSTVQYHFYLQMQQLRSREVNKLLKGTQLSGRAQIWSQLGTHSLNRYIIQMIIVLLMQWRG